MSMEVSKKDLSLLISLLGILIAVIVFNFVFTPYSDKANALKSENAKLKNKVQVLQSLANQRDDLTKKIDENKQETRAVLEHFPSDVREEDFIMFAVNMQNQAPFESISSVQIGNPTELYVINDVELKTDEAVASFLGEEIIVPEAGPEETEEAPAIEEVEELSPGEVSLDGNYTLKARTAEIVGVSTYEGFKQAVRMITGRQDRTQVAVMASYDIESGLVDSSISMTANYMTGTGKPYVAPNIPFITQGTNNIFGTVSLNKTAADAVEESTEENAEESATTEE